jgi:hypothetical protein
MCGAKTENLALNVCHAEADFWRRLAKAWAAKSRGDFQKMLLVVGLAQVDPKAVKELTAIREHYRRFGAAALLAVFCLTAFDHEQARVARRGVRVKDEAVLTTDEHG